MSNLKEQIQEDMKAAMRAKETVRLGTIRMLMAAIKQREIDERITLNDTDILNIINKMIKQRHDSAKQYTDAGRAELAEKENQEIVILEAYLPTQLNDADIEAAVMNAITEANASQMQDMGNVMSILKSKLAGQADMGKVGNIVKAKLGK